MDKRTNELSEQETLHIPECRLSAIRMAGWLEAQRWRLPGLQSGSITSQLPALRSAHPL